MADNDNCPCKRQRLRQGTDAQEEEDGSCAFSELRSFLDVSQEPEPAGTTLPLHDNAGDRVPGLGSQLSEHTKDEGQGDKYNSNDSTVESNMATKALHMGNENFSRNLAPDCGNVNNNEGGDMNYFSGLHLPSFREYDLETGQAIEQPVEETTLRHITHEICVGDGANVSKSTCVKKQTDRHADLSLQNYRQSQNSKRISTEHSDQKVHALAENSLIGSLEKSKFIHADQAFNSRESVNIGACSSSENEGQNISILQLECNDSLMEEGASRVNPPEYLTDTGFIDMFSSDHVSVGHTTSSYFTSNRTDNRSTYVQSQNSNNNNQRRPDKSLFRIKPDCFTQCSVRTVTETKPLLTPCSFTKKKQNELFDIDATSIKEDNCDSCAINSLPCSLILEIFKYLTPCCLLRNVSTVCKYWYNLSRDPGLWRILNLRNQHKLTDEILEQLLSFTERVHHVNLTDCRFITDKGVKMMLSRCTYLQTLKLMRCFDLTDDAFAGVAVQRLCRELTALHLDGCYKISDKTLLELAEGCKSLKLLHLNQCNKVSDAGVIALAQNCQQLRQLLLDHCDKVTDSGATALVAGCPELVYINFMSCGVSDLGVREFAKVTDSGATALVAGCPDLVYINFMSCGVSDLGVREFAKLKNLANVDLSNIPRLTPGPVIEIARRCERLESINISLNSVIDDDCVAYIARYCRRLKRLYCVSCSITDKGLEEIAKSCPTLEAIDVGWCQDVTDHGVRVISLACKHLDYFGLIRCDKVTQETVEELVLKYPQINYSTFILESRRLLARARREGFQCVSEELSK